MPITKWRFNNDGNRDELAAAINSSGGKLVDIGGARSCLDGKCKIDLIVDHAMPISKCDKNYVVDLQSDYYLARIENLINSARNYERYDWAVCTHTIEDLNWPKPCLEWLPRIAKRGYIATPAPWHDLHWQHGTLGFIHHYWVWTVEEGVLTGYPKLPHFLCPSLRDEVISKADAGHAAGKGELELWWEDNLPFRLVNISVSMEDAFRIYREFVDRM